MDGPEGLVKGHETESGGDFMWKYFGNGCGYRTIETVWFQRPRQVARALNPDVTYVIFGKPVEFKSRGSVILRFIGSPSVRAMSENPADSKALHHPWRRTLT